MSPSREHLLGYLLEALERTEEEQVEQELQTNPALRRELLALERCLGRIGLDEAPEPFEPPAGLAGRTCQFVAAETMVMPADARLPAGMSVELNGSSRLRWADLLVAAAVLLVAASLFFPALAYSHFQADIALCQNRLRELGLGMHQFSTQNPKHQFPAIEAEGNRDVAGIYAPLLVSHQLVGDPRTFVCPSSELSRHMERMQIPTFDELRKASGPKLASFQRTMGGDFGYNMGYTQGDEIVPPRDSRRCQYVLLGDAPSDEQPGRRSANHLGRGQNLLCEDGHVSWVVNLVSPHVADDPFHNHHGHVAAGIDPNDSVLGASFDRPIPVRLIKH